MKKGYIQKRIYLNEKKTKYCRVLLFGKKLDMQVYYDLYCKNRGLPDKGHYKVRGVSIHYEKVRGNQVSPETGMILLCVEDCGAGVVSHEFIHAVLWARGHKKYKKQYPIVIKSMKQEEEIAHAHTYAIVQFYSWFWKVKDRVG